MKVSIVINNYNYGRFIAEAIDSALAQSWPELEVVVVDDGSTDDSRQIIARYGSSIVTVLKENGGQASALNAGFNASSGEIVLFLDSDDHIFPGAVAQFAPLFADPDVVKAHWPLREVNEAGVPSGRNRPHSPLPRGRFPEIILQHGPTSSTSSPTSGNAWKRAFLERIMPIPESIDYYRTCADEYLYTLAPVFGVIAALDQPLGIYRIHGRNIYSARSGLDKLKLEVEGHEQQCRALAQTLARAGFNADPASWRRHSWFHRLQAALEELTGLIPEGERFLLADGDTWDARELLPRHTPVPFLEQEGESWGPPADDDSAIAELARARSQGIGFLVVAWPAFWWFDAYPRFMEQSIASFNLLLHNDRLAVFDLRHPRTTPPSLNSAPDEPPLISIVINNYNYAHFLRESIDSALAQTHPHTEVIVVDDGSSDRSREIIAGYGDRIVPVLQPNGGQGAAYNSGFKRCRGRWICFLDADDLLLPTALEELIPLTRTPGISKLQWRMKVIDAKGRPTGKIIPRDPPPEGDLRPRTLSEGPVYDWHFTPPGSANLWPRPFLEQVFPMPEQPYRNGADVYLITLAPIFGRLLTAPRPLGCYRFHGNNNYLGRALDDERLINYLQRFDTNCRTLRHYLAIQGTDADPELWRQASFNHLWPRRLLRAKTHIRHFVPPGGRYLLVNNDEWGQGEPVPERTSIPFLEHNGEYWGHPADDTQALAELDRLQRAGAGFIVFWWTSFWWLEHYPGLHRHLRSHCPCVVDDPSVIIFQLTPAPNRLTVAGPPRPAHNQANPS